MALFFSLSLSLFSRVVHTVAQGERGLSLTGFFFLSLSFHFLCVCVSVFGHFDTVESESYTLTLELFVSSVLLLIPDGS